MSTLRFPAIALDHWELLQPIGVGNQKIKHILATPGSNRLEGRSIATIYPVLVFREDGENVTALARSLPQSIDIWKHEGWFVGTVTFVPET